MRVDTTKSISSEGRSRAWSQLKGHKRGSFAFWQMFLRPLPVSDLEEVYQIWVERQNQWATDAALLSKRSLAREFYASKAWRRARYMVLTKSNRCCEICGNGPRTGKSIHVDHILPRWLFPEKSIDPRNLRVLCEDCNLGKSGSVHLSPEKVIIRRATGERSVIQLRHENWAEKVRALS